MTVDTNDRRTQLLPGVPKPKRPRGRPATGKALTPAEKQRRYREAKRAMGAVTVSALVRTVTHAALEKYALTSGRTISDAVDEILAFFLIHAPELHHGHKPLSEEVKEEVLQGPVQPPGA